MRETNNTRCAFDKGKLFYEKKNYSQARECFNISIYSSKYRYNSLIKLLYIELKMGNYREVRRLLDENYEKVSLNEKLKLQEFYGRVDSIESNYESSIEHYNNSLENTHRETKVLLHLARLHVQLGNYEKAQAMYRELQSVKEYEVIAIFELIYLNIIIGEYEYAYILLNLIDSKKITRNLRKTHQTLSLYLLKLLGCLKSSDNVFNPNVDYSIYRIFDPSDILLLKHLEKHHTKQNNLDKGYFFPELSLKELLNQVKEEITALNANHFESSDIYLLHFQKPVGYDGGYKTHDLRVVTRLGTKEIITMHPILLSNEFDKEGMNTSRELYLKRKYAKIDARR